MFKSICTRTHCQSIFQQEADCRCLNALDFMIILGFKIFKVKTPGKITKTKNKSRKVRRWFSSATAQMSWKKLGLKCPQQIDCLQFNLLPSSSLHQKLTNHKKLGGRKRKKKKTSEFVLLPDQRERGDIRENRRQNTTSREAKKTPNSQEPQWLALPGL